MAVAEYAGACFVGAVFCSYSGIFEAEEIHGDLLRKLELENSHSVVIQLSFSCQTMVIRL